MCLQTPGATDPRKSEGDTLAAQLQMAPQVYAANSEYSPLYTSLALGNLNQFLNGGNGQPGFLSLYQNQIAPAQANTQVNANSLIRRGNVADATTLAPQLTSLARTSNPGGASLLDTLTSNTSRDLGYGTELTPAERVQLNQSVRAGSAARGTGFSPSSVFDESMADTGFGQQLYQQRQGAAQNLVPALQSFYPNPMGVTAAGDTGTMTAGQLTGTGSGSAAPSMLTEFNPESAMALQYGQNTFLGHQDEANAYNSAFTQGAQSGMSTGGGMMSSM